MNRDTKKQSLNRFLAEVETSAFKISRSMLRDEDAALDVIQDAMLKFVQKYSDKPQDEWSALFFRIVQNTTKDVLRKRKLKQRIFGWFGSDEYDDMLKQQRDNTANPELLLHADQTRQQINHEIRALPAKQQEVVQLRLYEQMKLETIAQTMQISIGSVKTHLSRAMHKLKPILMEQQETV